MRTTVNLDDDVAAAIALKRAAEGIGLSEALNALVRRALIDPVSRRRAPFKQRTVDLGISIDISNTAEALEILEGPTAR